jgi:hypothetical protein
MRAKPTRYREVVLTSCHRIENDSQRSIIVLPLTVYVKSNGKWQIVSDQGTLVTP